MASCTAKAGTFLSVLLWLASAACAGDRAASPASPVNLVRDVGDLSAAISVDSTFPGYGIRVLSDGKWIRRGEESTQEWGNKDRLGNGGNTWVSADTDIEHWIRVDWPKSVTVDELEIWWSLPDWRPRAFRVEFLRGGKWTPAFGDGCWLAAADQRSVVTFAPVQTQSLRVVQAPGGGGSRDFMAVQEVLAYHQRAGTPRRAGVRELTAGEIRRLQRRGLTRNLARLDCPGAAFPLVWLPADRQMPAEWLADGHLRTAGPLESDAAAFGVRWPIGHVADGMAIVFADNVPDPAVLVAEAHDGVQWVAVRQGLRAERRPNEHRLVYSFEPVATRAIRARLATKQPRLSVTEMEVYRFLPPRKDVWPDRLTKRVGLKQEILAAEQEPSFEALALCALPMTPARAALGLKDAPHEIGATWDGTLISRITLRFGFGERRDALADCRDTVQRRLIDGWRPGTIVEGQIGDMAVRETALIVPLEGEAARPALFVRVELQNLIDKPVKTAIQAEVSGPSPEPRFHDRMLVRGSQVALVSQSECAAGQDGRALRVDLLLGPRQKAHADFVHPHTAVAPGPALEPYRSTTFDQALARFRSYWDRTLGGAAGIEVPEPRVNRMVRAVLAQIFVNGNGDVMPYGSEPSVYAHHLYGVEESYAMLALAMCGFGGDAQRYLDGTYLTREFLKKVEVYKDYPDRHQQYRNGLEPHYAVSAHRLSRDAVWIRKHLPLLRECAEWTMAQRRKTMNLEAGEKPLHWGLLPKWSYGGDISQVQCYALYANYCCWRGLVDTAWLLRELGDAEGAGRYAKEAGEYRAAIDRAVEGSFRKAHRPPFLPLRLYADRPDEQMDYYQLFAGCILDLEPFGSGSEHFAWIADFLEEDNRTFCFLPRFRRDVGPGGLDALYGKGYLLGKLRQDAVREFLLGFYAFLAFNMDHETFVSRETNLLYASDLHVRSAYPVPDISDPVPCSSAVALQLLRHMLVTEETAGAGEYSGNLLLLSAAPRAWLRDGQMIRLTGVPTHFGPVSLEVRSQVRAGRIEVKLDAPRRNPCRGVKVRVRHPDARPIRSVTVDGKSWRDFDPAGSWIVLPGSGGSRRITVNY